MQAGHPKDLAPGRGVGRLTRRSAERAQTPEDRSPAPGLIGRLREALLVGPPLALVGVPVLASLALGTLVPRLDDRHIPWLASRMGEPATVALLSATASGMMVFTGIVFSLLFVILQFASMAYSPRIVAIVTKPRTLGKACGMFVGTFVYALLALRGVGSLPNGGTSGLTILVALAWVFGSIWMLMRLAQAVAGLTQANVLYLIGDTGRREIERTTSSRPGPTRTAGPLALGPATQTLVHQGSPRYFLGTDVDRVVALASQAAAVVHVPLSTGDPIAPGSVLASVHGGQSRVSEEALRGAFRLGRDRVLEGDPKYALRILVDIALRALSPGLHEPTIAILALDQIESLLVVLGAHPLDVGEVRDGDGTVRLVYDATTWDDYVDLCFAEIQQYGSGSLQVERRLAALLSFLLEHVPSDRRATLERLERVRVETLDQRFPNVLVRSKAACRDRQGLGHSRERARPSSGAGTPALGDENAEELG